MRFRTIFFYPFFLCLLIISSQSFAAGQKSSTEVYIDNLHRAGQERVMVFFKSEIDPSLIEKYNGKIIKELSVIKCAVCEIPQENIELLKEEPSVEKVTIDAVIKAKPGCMIRDAAEERILLKCKKEYLRKILTERNAAIRNATQEYLQSIRKYLAERQAIMKLYNSALKLYKKANKKNQQFYLGLLNKYKNMLKDCEDMHRSALQQFRESVRLANEEHKIAASLWVVKANEMMAMSYTGSVTIRWEHLTTGSNTKAAWDRYGLDGTGIKIAFLDTGINYGINPTWPMPNLATNYFGGYDFVDNDSDPMPYIDPTSWELTENHGTLIASNCVGAGINKVIGAVYNAKYYSLRILSGPEAEGWTSDAIAAIYWCIDPDSNPLTNDKPDIINMSFGTYEEGSDKSALQTACDAAYAAGIVLVAASGNDGYSYSTWPASFSNVISAGGHAEDQTIYSYNGGSSNGGVDIVAPGEAVYTVTPENYGCLIFGTSTASGITSGIIALQLQYARNNNIQPNHGYLWELMKHSAKHLTGQTYDPVYQGTGKVWAAETIAPTAPPYGSIDCMAAKWPLSFEPFNYYSYIGFDEQGYPAYYIGTMMFYDFTLANNTATIGNYASNIDSVQVQLPTPHYVPLVTTTQAYYQALDEVTLPGAAVEEFLVGANTIYSTDPGSTALISDSYFLPWEMYPGLDRIILDLQFKFADDTNNRLVQVKYPYASIWCPPPLLNEGFPAQ